MGNSFRQTVAGLFARDEMNASTLLSGHVAATRARAQASESEYLIAAQDTTYHNYSGQAQMSGLGVIQGKVRALMQHVVLLIDERGLPLGVIDQQYWTRDGAMDWPAAQKASQKWFNGLAAVNQQAQGSEPRWVVTCDRESDIFDFCKAPRASNVELLVPVFQPRRVEVSAAGTGCLLPTVAAHLDDYGQYSVQIERHCGGQRRTVDLTLHLHAATVHIYPNQDLSPTRHKTQTLSLVVATEVACADAKTQADW